MKKTAKETAYHWSPELSPLDYVAYRMEKLHGHAGTSVLSIDVLDAVPIWKRLQKDVDRTSRILLRMRQRVVVPALPFTSARWVTDPDFDLNYHLRRICLPEPGSFRQLLDLAGTLQATPLDLNRPLWEATLVEGLDNTGGGAAAIIWKFNPAVIDGSGRLVFERFLRSDKRGPDRARMPPIPSPEDLSSKDLTRQQVRRLPLTMGRAMIRRAGGAIRSVPNTIRQPAVAVERAAGMVELLQRVTGPADRELSTLHRRRGPNRRFETMEVTLAELREAARKHECSVTDAYVAAACGALRLYHERLGVPDDAVQLTMPISLASGDDPAGGQFWSAVRIAALMDEADPVERMRTVRDAVVTARTEPSISAFGAVAPLASWLPDQVFTNVAETAAGIEVLISNAGGHPGPAHVSGARLTRVVPIAPLAGARMGMVMYSLDGRCHIGVNLDTAAVTEPELFMKCLQRGFDEVIAVRKMVSAKWARRVKRRKPGARVAVPRGDKLRQPGTVAKIDADHDGPEVAAFFDLDGTLIAGYSARYVTQDRSLRPEFSGSELLRALLHVVNNGIDESFAELLDLGAGAWRGRTLEDLDEMGLRMFEKNIRDLIYPEMREIVEAHRRRGHTIVLSSSASSFQVEPVARYLGIDHVVCNRFITEEGVLTGQVQRPVVWGVGKANAAQVFADEHGIDLGRSYFYADGDEDAALMYLVGNPRPTNPGKQLARVAEKRGWPVQRFTSRGSSPGKLVRNVAGLGAGLPIIGLGIGIGWARGDKRAGINFVFENWLDAMFRANNVNINVIGEDNAWVQRPAVFILNHRTTFDGLVAISVVRKDFTAVSKAENKGGGPVFDAVERLLDIAYIDRSDAASAVASMKPLEELARSGLSVLIAPEGTRVTTAGTGPFKKGAFRIAMAAGLPIVPIVIRNAEAIGGRDALAMNPGKVDVAVLKPISVDNWTVDDLPQHIEEVRQLYIDTLAHWPHSTAEFAELPADH
jgi:putative phosphoserine phosphatase / 1-acylglycerol-3-phosphate O-acyltransferase